MTEMPAKSRVTRHQPTIPPRNNYLRFRADLGLCNLSSPWCTTQKIYTTLMDKVVYGTLGDPITPDYVRDVNDLEQKR
jgi:hypothetical protein